LGPKASFDAVVIEEACRGIDVSVAAAHRSLRSLGIPAVASRRSSEFQPILKDRPFFSGVAAGYWTAVTVICAFVS